MYVGEVTDQRPAEGQATDNDANWALLERVVNSPRMQRAARLREFLLYVGRRTLKEGSDQIHEQEIGSEVFGRPAAYDTSVDNIVRVNATELRKRIEAYFEAEGAQEPVILEIPRGSYRPTFHLRTADLTPVPRSLEIEIVEPKSSLDGSEPDSTQAVPTKSIAKSTAASGHGLLIAASVAVVALSVACTTLWLQNRTMHQSLFAWQNDPALESFWSQIFEARPHTDIVLADTSFSLIEDITKRPIALKDYLNRRYVSQIQSQDLSHEMTPERRDDLNLILTRNYGSTGDFRVAQHIAALDPLAHNLRIDYAAEYSAGLVKQDNVILIGSRKSNPWVDLFASSLNFTVEFDIDRRMPFVRNRTPQPGEQEAYTAPPPPDSTTGYSVVAYLPNPGQPGKVLILAGTDSEATEGAGEFITSAEQLARFQKLLHVQKLPYFEVLLKTTHLSATPLNATIVAYRTYPNQH